MEIEETVSTTKPQGILVFASGSRKGGGSGFRNLVEATRSGIIQGQVLGVVSNHYKGGVTKQASELGIPFHHMSSFDTDAYRSIVDEESPDLICLSGWLKFVMGLDSKMVINIHPGLLPQTGGLWGDDVHIRAVELARAGEITHTAVTMHFVTTEDHYDKRRYDVGPTFFRYPVPIYDADDADSLRARVNSVEYAWQAWVTNEVLHDRIRWDGDNPASLVVPSYVPLIPVERLTG